MDTILNKFNSYNFLTKYFLFTLAFGLLSLDFLFFWSLLWLAMSGAYHIWKAFVDNEHSTKSSALLCQEEFENGKNEFNFLFFAVSLLCLFQGELLYLAFLATFFLAKSIFIKDKNREQNSDNVNLNI